MRNRTEKVNVPKKRWAAYAVASASMVCGTQSATADITVVTPNVELRDDAPFDGYFGDPYQATFGPEGNNMDFFHGTFGTSTFSYGVLGIYPADLTGAPNSHYMSFAGFFNGDRYLVSNIPYGQPISELTNFTDSSFGVIAFGSSYASADFYNTGGYLAIRFNVGHGTQYGWAELSLDAGAPTNHFTLERYAWSSAGTSLRVGQTSVPEPGSLGLLAIGAMGLLRWRGSRTKTKNRV